MFDVNTASQTAATGLESLLEIVVGGGLALFIFAAAFGLLGSKRNISSKKDDKKGGH